MDAATQPAAPGEAPRPARTGIPPGWFRHPFSRIASWLIVFLSVLLLCAQRAPSHDGSWRFVRGEPPTFDLDAPAFAGMHRVSFVSYSGEQRSEWLKVSGLGEPGPMAMIEVRTGPRGMFAAVPIRERLRDVSALRGAQISFSNEYYDLSTRYDVLRATPFVARADGMIKNCVGFQSNSPDRTIYVSGLVCDPTDHGLEAADLACLADTLTLTGRFARPEAQALLSDRLRRPKACGLHPVGRAPTPADRANDAL